MGRWSARRTIRKLVHENAQVPGSGGVHGRVRGRADKGGTVGCVGMRALHLVLRRGAGGRLRESPYVDKA